MNKKEYYDLYLENGLSFFCLPDYINEIKEELEKFLWENSVMNNIDFSSNLLFSQAIKFNNTIEGYDEDVVTINKIIERYDKGEILLKEEQIRIINLYKGYRYILNNEDINKDTLRELSSILSSGLLSKEDKKNTGKYYRNNDVYIYFSRNIETEPDMGISPHLIEKHMNILFEYINKLKNGTLTEHFINSQLIHFYFVYIHPYYDINGRTSRTMSMWYLLNNNSHPYIIFNRAIILSKRKYYETIRRAKTTHNLTPFLLYMLTNVKMELEKELIISSIKELCPNQLEAIDEHSLYYILSTKHLRTINDFITFYNMYNGKKRSMDIYNEMLLPLLEKGIITKVRDTKGFLANDKSNFVYQLSNRYIDIDRNQIKRLKLQ